MVPILIFSLLLAASTRKVLNVVSTPLFGHLNPCFKIALELHQSYDYQINVLVSPGMDASMRRAYPELSFDNKDGINLIRSSCLDDGVADELFARVGSDPLENENDFLFSSLALLNWTSSLGACYNSSLSEPLWRNGGGFLLDIFASSTASVCDQLGVPCVINNPSLLPLADQVLASSVSTLFYGTAASTPTLLHRLLRPALDIIVYVGGRVHAWQLADQPIGDWLESRLVLTNSFFGLEYPRDLPPNVVMTGPLLSAEQPPPPKSRTPRSLPDSAGPLDLDSWLDASSPIVFASFGTLSLLNKTYCRLVETKFHELAQAGRDEFSFLFKSLCTESASEASFRVERWLPGQEAVLSHPNVRVFISHCGVNSVHESVAAGVPVLCLPHFAEQLDMAQRLTASGAGRYLPKYAALLNVSLVKEQVLALLTEPVYAEAAQRLGPMARLPGGVKRAAQLVDHYQQHPHALRVSFGTWAERKNIDLYACFLATALVLFLVPRLCARSH